jgi:hypothetical protein
VNGVSLAISGRDLSTIVLNCIGDEGGNNEAASGWIRDGDPVEVSGKGVIQLPSYTWVFSAYPLRRGMRRISLRGTGGCRGAPVLVVVVFFLFIVGVPVSGGIVVGLGVLLANLAIDIVKGVVEEVEVSPCIQLESRRGFEVWYAGGGVSLRLSFSEVVGLFEVSDSDLDLRRTRGSERCRRKERLTVIQNFTIFQLDRLEVEGVDAFGVAKLISLRL